MNENIVIISNTTLKNQTSTDDMEIQKIPGFINILLIILVILMIFFIYNLVRCYLPALINKNKRRMEEEEVQNNPDNISNTYQRGNTINLEDN